MKITNYFNRGFVYMSLKRNFSTGAQIIAKFQSNYFKHGGIYTGGAVMPIIDELYKLDKMELFKFTHEQHMAHAATGYYRASGKIFPINSTSGPGCTNLVTGLLDATLDSVSVLAITGQVGVNKMGSQSFQEAPATQITKSITKFNKCVKDVNELHSTLLDAVLYLTDNRLGSVHIDVPKCVLTSKSDNPKYTQTYIKDNYDDYNVDKIAELIKQASRPVLYVGQGCDSELLRKFAIKMNIPVTTTIHGNGMFDENHELSLKFLGMHGSYVANWAVQNSDLIIAIGCRFDDRTTGEISKYAPMAYQASKQGKGGIVFCNNDRPTIDMVRKYINFDHVIYNTSKHFLTKLNEIDFTKTHDYWVNLLNNMKHKYKFCYKTPPYYRINTQMVIEEINNQIKNKDFIITTGVGNHQMMTSQFITWTKPNTFISSGSLGVMGTGLPYAIGAKISSPDKEVILIDGDGSFNMSFTELITVARYNLPIKMFIINDECMSMVQAWENLFYGGRTVATDLENPDYSMIAAAHKIPSFVCNNINNLRDTIKKTLKTPGPVLCELVVDSDYCFPLVPPGNALDDVIHPEYNDNKVDTSKPPPS